MVIWISEEMLLSSKFNVVLIHEDTLLHRYISESAMLSRRKFLFYQPGARWGAEGV